MRGRQELGDPFSQFIADAAEAFKGSGTGAQRFRERPMEAADISGKNRTHLIGAQRDFCLASRSAGVGEHRTILLDLPKGANPPPYTSNTTKAFQ